MRGSQTEVDKQGLIGLRCGGTEGPGLRVKVGIQGRELGK